MRIVPLLALLPSIGIAAPFTYVVGKVRIQILSPNLVRLEQQGPRGFEDRATFTVVNRNFAKASAKVSKLQDRVIIQTAELTVVAANEATSLDQVAVFDSNQAMLYRYNGKLPMNGALPAPGSVPQVWTMSDTPRLVPPAWGATPAPKHVDPALAAKSGWDDRNDAPDVYVFVPGKGGYRQLRSDFLRLTGPVPKPPLFILGFIDSRWYPYTEKEALDSIDTYRKKRIPLDTFVVDTDWRINGSDGYEVEKRDFPDMPRFIKEAHERNVRLMFNDHPNPKAEGATDPKELAFRWQGLSKLLDWGMDVWWYDRNWSTSLHEPMPGIHKEVWGQRLYHDMTQKARPDQRPWIMTNAQGIDNGRANYSADPAGHRYPMWWTGDTGSQFEFLKRGVENGVDRGLLDLQPYTHEDLGGHTGPTPSPELYVRYLEYGCLSPITRVHCTRGQDRHPWAYGPEAERITTDYIKLRYRLLPMLYSAAQRATDDGTPILRRCDFYWPNAEEAVQNDQYMLGDDILVAPIIASVQGEMKPISTEMLRTPDGKPGLQGEYFDNTDLKGNPKQVRTDAQIAFDWSGSSPIEGIGQEDFSVRWTGTLGPVPETGQYRIVTKNDDGVRVYIDGKLIVDDWKPEDSVTNEAVVRFAAGSTHTLRIEYLQLGGNALCTIGWYKPSEAREEISHRTVWIPPGRWHDLWSGKTLDGPQTITVSAELNQTPMWVGHGGIVLTGPDLQYTGEKPMDPITADVTVGGSFVTKRELVEDDGISTAYIKGDLARTTVSAIGDDSTGSATVWLGATKGDYKGMAQDRNWIVRLHLPEGKTCGALWVDGQPAKFSLEPHRTVTIPFRAGAAPGEGDVVTVKLPTASIRDQHVVKIAMKG
jgi:alpha-glucosidase (family GH31 glycosyl hydrolase)